MLNNNLKTTWRSLWRKRTFTLLNILGLAVGIGASLAIFLVIRGELSYDAYHVNKDRIFRVVTIISAKKGGGELQRSGSVSANVAPALRTDFPQLEQVAQVWYNGGAQIYVPAPNQAEEKRFNEGGGIYFLEPSLFDIFDFTWLEGNAGRLSEPHTTVLTESLAKTYFGSAAQAMGQTIQLWSYRVPLTVVGVFRDPPVNTDLPIRIGASYATMLELNPNLLSASEWLDIPWASQCFMLLRKGQDPKTLEAQLPSFVKRHYPQENEPETRSLTLQALPTMHLDDRTSTLVGHVIPVSELWSLGLIGLFLVVVACINFVNLATAQSVTRAKEIGVRKVLGSSRAQLMVQFMRETALITAVALLLGCIIAELALPILNQLMQKPISMDVLHHPAILGYMLLVGILVTLLAGFYPAVVVSGFDPVAAIKSKISTRSIGGISLRRSLVVVQFVIAQLLVIGTLVVIKQMHYFKSRPLGFTQTAVALLDLPSDSLDITKYNYLKASMLAVPGVREASLCSDGPTDWGGNFPGFRFDGRTNKEAFSIEEQNVDTSFLRTFDISLAAGRLPFTADTTSTELLVNETTVRKLGFSSPGDILGKTMDFGTGRVFTIVGIVHDYNTQPLRGAIQPLALLFQGSYKRFVFLGYEDLAVRMDPKQLQETLPQVQKLFSSVFPSYLYDCTFLDDRIASFYQDENRTAQLFKTFSLIAIFISCLGLYGLVSFMAVQKTKEVGIRKVLGASVKSIVYLFSREFTWLILLAFVVSAPLGYYFMHGWLNGFYYHTQMGWIEFALAIAGSLLIAWATVGYKAYRAALANPINSLKYE
jgi:putative ABC transport system permease protein